MRVRANGVYRGRHALPPPIMVLNLDIFGVDTSAKKYTIVNQLLEIDPREFRYLRKPAKIDRVKFSTYEN